jgi:hypothetical protein
MGTILGAGERRQHCGVGRLLARVARVPQMHVGVRIAAHPDEMICSETALQAERPDDVDPAVTEEVIHAGLAEFENVIGAALNRVRNGAGVPSVLLNE